MAVYIKQRAVNNIKNIFTRLVLGKSFVLPYGEAQAYVNDIEDECYAIEKCSFHYNAVRAEHYKFGQKVHTYKRNEQTEWYFIYDIDKHDNIIVKRIMCNNEMKETS